jgi:hypothetical protein
MSTEPMFNETLYGSAEAAREAEVKWLRERVAELEAQNTGLLEQHSRDSKELRSLCDSRDRLRAASVIEWEPGRSYTAAELLRRAIRGLHVRKGRPLWPAVMNLCGVGSTVAHYLCRWAGRDPDTGANLDAARAARGKA